MGCGKPGARSICSTPFGDGRFDITQFPQYDCPLSRIYDAAFGSPDYYSYVAGNLKQFMDDHYIADVRQGMQGLKDKPYVLFYACSCTHTAAAGA